MKTAVDIGPETALECARSIQKRIIKSWSPIEIIENAILYRDVIVRTDERKRCADRAIMGIRKIMAISEKEHAIIIAAIMQGKSDE